MLRLTTYQEKLIAVILTQPADVGVRTDVLARATGTTNRDVPVSLLQLREQGLIASVNDGGAYNSWHTTPKLRKLLADRHNAALVAGPPKTVSKADYDAVAAELRGAEAVIRVAEAVILDAEAEILQLKGKLADALARLRAATKGTYVLWNPSSTKAPSVTYPTLADGRKVAETMAKRCPGETFNLCKLVEKFKYIQPKPQPKAGLIVEKL